MKIIVDDLTGPQIAALLETHLELMRSQSPACSVHALDLDKLRDKSITFWSAWEDETLIGCVALKQHDTDLGEIKSMHTAQAGRGKGVGSALLTHLEKNAKAAGLSHLSLETGSQPEFDPARKLYTKFGYTICAPFADYELDPNSVFMTKPL